uniref:Uncharacterized protein n=1 Tax=Steinernema glaseri TaxID=37863 RepID=A0A1I8A0N1_9BILA
MPSKFRARVYLHIMSYIDETDLLADDTQKHLRLLKTLTLTVLSRTSPLLAISLMTSPKSRETNPRFFKIVSINTDFFSSSTTTSFVLVLDAASALPLCF